VNAVTTIITHNLSGEGYRALLTRSASYNLGVVDEARAVLELALLSNGQDKLWSPLANIVR
jgi:hypothetical protein